MAGPGAADVNDELSFKRWLDEIPEHRRHQSAIVLATRAATRVVVFVNRSGQLNQKQRYSFQLAIFRAITSSRAAATYPEHKFATIPPVYGATRTFAAARVNSLVAEAANAAAQVVAYTAPVAVVASYAAAAAARAADAARAAAFDDAARTTLAAEAAAEAGAAMWSALQKDAADLERGAIPINVKNRPLWLAGGQGWWTDGYLALRAHLTSSEATADHWPVWWDWYDSIAAGRPAFRLPEKMANELELRIALGDSRKNFWNREPGEINTEIESWVKEAQKKLSGREPPELLPAVDNLPDVDSLPDPHRAVAQFEQRVNGKIVIVPDTPIAAPTRKVNELEELYQEGREKAHALLALGQNRLGNCFEPVKALADHLTQDFQQASINRVWSKVSTLRGILLQHIQEQEKPSNIRDISLILEVETASKLHDCVSQLNLFIAFDERGRELDRLSFGPEARSRSEAVVSAATPIIVNMGNVAEGAAVTVVMGDHNSVATAKHNIHGDQAVERIAKQDENFAIRVLLTGWKIAKQVAQSGLGEPVAQIAIAVAGENGPAILQFVAENKAAFTNLVGYWNSSKEVIEIVNVIAELAKYLN